jgi:cytochrome c oxidase cbb3-type subunit II
MMFIRSFVFFFGVLATLLLGWAALVGIPDIMISEVRPPEELERYTAKQLYGRQIYIREGCVYCHSQQVRPEGFGADQERLWGRPSVPADYVYDWPHLLGTMRTGPDLMNIGARQTSVSWHMEHLYDPRLVVEGSIMPPYPWLFEVKRSAGPDEYVLDLPEDRVPEGMVVVATREAEALVEYLLSLDRTYDAPQRAVELDGNE